MIKYDASFIKDIDADPRFIETMLDKMIDHIHDEVEDFAFQIMTDYCPAPDDDMHEDALHEQILMPLEGRILDQIALAFIQRCLNAYAPE